MIWVFLREADSLVQMNESNVQKVDTIVFLCQSITLVRFRFKLLWVLACVYVVRNLGFSFLFAAHLLSFKIISNILDNLF